jgi:hypothetical protein
MNLLLLFLVSQAAHYRAGKGVGEGVDPLALLLPPVLKINSNLTPLLRLLSPLLLGEAFP